MLRHSADWRSVLYLGVVTSLGTVQWNLGAWNPALYAPYLGLFVAVAVISHNHNHVSMWRSRTLNLITNYVISIHYGHPAIAWVPTHNQNHHKFNNREGDTGRSPAVFRKNHLLALLIYPTVTGIRQQADVSRFFRDLWARDRRGFFAAASEYVVFFGFLAAVLWLDWRRALVLYVLPQQFALFMIQVFNYVQHVEADAESAWNHSRNFESPMLNALLFNNGYHTVHHLKPGLHWSLTPALHAEHAPKIHSELRVRSWWGYMAWTFLLRPLVPGAQAPSLAEASSKVDASLAA